MRRVINFKKFQEIAAPATEYDWKTTWESLPTLNAEIIKVLKALLEQQWVTDGEEGVQWHVDVSDIQDMIDKLEAEK